MDYECPDWTELTSTLEFPKAPPPPPAATNAKAVVGGNMDTLLTTSAGNLAPPVGEKAAKSTVVAVNRQVRKKAEPTIKVSF